MTQEAAGSSGLLQAFPTTN